MWTGKERERVELWAGAVGRDHGPFENANFGFSAPTGNRNDVAVLPCAKPLVCILRAGGASEVSNVRK